MKTLLAGVLFVFAWVCTAAAAPPKKDRQVEPNKAERLYKEARAAKKASDLRKAESLYLGCLVADKTHLGCRGDVAVILMARGKRCDAITHMRIYVKAAPKAAKSVQFRRLIEAFEPGCHNK